MKRTLLLTGITLLLAAVIWLVPVPVVRFWSSFVLLWVLPGLVWIPFLTQIGLSSTEEKITIALGLNFVITPIITLTAAYLPGKLSGETLLLLMLLMIVVPMILYYFYSQRIVAGQESTSASGSGRRTEPSSKWWKAGWFWLLVILTIAAFVRVVNLGYSEFQGDEAAVLIKSARIITGHDTVLFEHKKGPAELLLTMAGWRLTGITNEWMSRLAFSWAGLLGVAGIFLYGYRQNRLTTAIIAAGILALEGYLVGFGRIVQYQSLVFLTSTMAMLCLLIFANKGKGVFVIIAAAFYSVGTWAHYDAILFLPAGLLLLAYRLLDDRKQWRHHLPAVLIAGLLGLLLVGFFYIPFLRGSQVEGTLFYVSGRIGSEKGLYNHLLSTFGRSFVYDSVYLLVLIFVGLTTQMFFTWRRWGRGAAVAAVVLILAGITTLVYPEWWEVGETTYAWTILLILLFGSLIAPRQNVGIRAIWLWLGIPALFYLYFVALPLTHVYTTVPGAALLAALGLVNLGHWLATRSQVLVHVAAAAAAALFIVSLSYTLLAFVNHSPEYLREYPASRKVLFWTPFAEDMPREGLFGFPYRAGWKTAGYLIDSGEISGSYDSNEERDVTDYYTRQAMRFDCATPDFYITAANVQDEVAVRFDQIETEFKPEIVVEVNGQPKMTIYKRQVDGQAHMVAAETFERLYDLGTTPEAVAEARPAIGGELPAGFLPIQAQIGDFALLSGYQIDTSHAQPGGYVELLLLWEALDAAAIDYQVFTHLHDGQDMRGQLDGQPVCNSAPTSQWHEGDYIVDPYRIPIHPEASTGPVPLTVGMYNLANLERLPVLIAEPAEAESVGGGLVTDVVHVTDVEIRENG